MRRVLGERGSAFSLARETPLILLGRLSVVEVVVSQLFVEDDVLQDVVLRIGRATHI